MGCSFFIKKIAGANLFSDLPQWILYNLKNAVTWIATAFKFSHYWCATRDLNPYGLPLEPKSSASANSASRAKWWLHRESNSGYRRERAVSWPLDHRAVLNSTYISNAYQDIIHIFILKCKQNFHVFFFPFLGLSNICDNPGKWKFLKKI